jgi:hypothetical protein
MARTAYDIVNPFRNLQTVSILCGANRFFVTFVLGENIILKMYLGMMD